MDINYLYHLQQFRGGPGSLLTSFLSKMTWWGAVGTMISCFIQIFYVVFLFPLLFMFLEKRAGEAQGNAMSGGGQSR